MYFKLDESSLNFLLEIAMQLRKYIWILRVSEWMKFMPYLTDKFMPGLTHIILYFLVEKYRYFSLTCSKFLNMGKAKTVKNFIRSKLIFGY